MLVSIITITALAAVTVVSAAPPLKRQAAPPPEIYSCTVNNTVALTFDDGPFDYIVDIVNTLNNASAKGTFFFNSDNYDCIYNRQDGIKAVYESGHQVASHTAHHEDLATLNWDQLHDEFWRVEQALQRILGVVPAFMRPPFGSFNDLVLEVAQVRGQRVIIWDFDSGDSVGATPEESKQSYDETVAKKPSNILALNHETEPTTAFDVLPYAINLLQSAGYELVTVAECLGGLEPYQSVGEPGVPDNSWRC